MTGETFGTVKVTRGPEGRDVWSIECQPHVAMRLRRLFPVAKSQGARILLSMTDEVSRDLEWFLDRYPMRVVDVAGTLEQLARAYDRRRQAALDIMAGTVELPSLPMAVPPRRYQEEAAALARTNGFLLLGDEVGLGKTASAIATFADPALRPALVVVQAHLPRQWKREIERFLPFAYVHIAKTGTPYDTSHRGRAPDVLIVTYHKLDGWRDHLAGRFRTVVFDEVQELRRGGVSAKGAAAKHAAAGADVRLGLSATPIHNYGEEFFNVFEVLAPGVFGSQREFRAEWCASHGERWPIKNPRAFGSYLRSSGMMLRRTRADVGRELPRLSRIVHEIDSHEVALSPDTKALAELILSRDTDPLARGQKMRAAGEFDMRMRQATGIAKAPYVAEFVRMLVEQGPVVLFAWHRLVYAELAERLRDLHPAWYTGAESAAQKADAVDRFVKGQTKLLILSLRSGSGLDGLQKVCSQVVIGELDWSPATHVQCLGRVHRDGQPDPVMAYFLVSDQGSDPVIADVLDLKRQQLEGAVDPDAPLSQAAAVDPDHVKKLAEAYLRRTG